ncbi:MAG: hypothetical protein HQM08_14790 [Candidatus Riflebacteria bacterium]|nr:hypothetical protein [Candidatus Riflebacteria bacterium]
MKSLARIMGIILLFAFFPFPAKAESQNATETNKLLEEISQIQEIWTKKITLDYLSDKRNSDFLKKLLKDFDEDIRNNFEFNILGRGKAPLIQNFNDKLAELSDFAADSISKNSQFDPSIFKRLKKTHQPWNLGYGVMVKKILQSRKFQLSHAEESQKTELKKNLNEWQSFFEQIASGSKSDLFPTLQQCYSKTPIKKFPLYWYDTAQHNVTYITEGQKPNPPASQGKKTWTILFYINADNDLERFGLMNMKQMEKIGSSDKINLVVQLDRLKQGEGNSISDGNWVGARRYFVTKNSDPAKLGSQMVMNLGEVDMGNPKSLADFLTWGVKTYPAERVAVIIWNHGMGWQGVSMDEESNRYLRLPDVSWALREGQKVLSQENGKPSKFALLDFDACLMATLEVAYELSDTVDFLTASQETEPGTGMPYADYLAPLAANPQMEPREFAKILVEKYVAAYSKKGSFTNKVIKGTSVTKSAIDLGKIPELVKLTDTLGSQLLSKHDIYIKLLSGPQKFSASIRKYADETLVDLADFCSSFIDLKDTPEDIRKTCEKIVQTVGYPVSKDKLSEKVVISSDQPASIIWGYNGWRMPPEELRPNGTKVFQSRLATSELEQIDEKSWSIEIGPFKPVIDKALGKKVFVNEINYQLVYANGKKSPKRTIKQDKEFLVVPNFPEISPLLAEGHTQGMGNSHGISIYYPPAYQFVTSYKTLKFAKDSKWAEFISRIPSFRREAPVLLVGQMVEDPITLFSIAKAVNANKVAFQVLWDPSLFGYNYKDILSKYSNNGLVIADSVSVSSMGKLAPSSSELKEFLENGGSLFIAAQSFEQANLNKDFLESELRFEYVDDERDFDKLSYITQKNETLEFKLNGEDSAPTEEDVTIMKATLPARIIAKLPDGKGAGLFISQPLDGDKCYSAIFFGFRFEAIDGENNRTKIMGDILERLYPQKNQLELFN